MYASNTHAGMTQALFEKWLRKLDLEFKCGKMNVLLVIDNCPAHRCVKGQEATQFLPPNTIAAVKPLDYGVMKNLKAHYRRLLLQRILLDMDSGMPYTVTLLTAIACCQMHGTQ